MNLNTEFSDAVNAMNALPPTPGINAYLTEIKLFEFDHGGETEWVMAKTLEEAYGQLCSESDLEEELEDIKTREVPYTELRLMDYHVNGEPVSSYHDQFQILLNEETKFPHYFAGTQFVHP